MKNDYEKFIDLMFNFDEKEMKREITILELITEKNEKINNLQAKIDRAIEFVEKNYLFEIDKTDKKLLDILKGSDSNE